MWCTKSACWTGLLPSSHALVYMLPSLSMWLNQERETCPGCSSTDFHGPIKKLKMLLSLWEHAQEEKTFLPPRASNREKKKRRMTEGLANYYSSQSRCSRFKSWPAGHTKQCQALPAASSAIPCPDSTIRTAWHYLLLNHIVLQDTPGTQSTWGEPESRRHWG